MRDLPRALWMLAWLTFGVGVVLALSSQADSVSPPPLPPLLFVEIAALAHFFALLRASRWLLVTLPVLAIALGYYGSPNGPVVAGPADLRAAFYWCALTVAGGHLALLDRSIRAVLFSPCDRWWLTPPRHRVRLSAVVRPVAGGELFSHSVNLSEGGVLIGTDKSDWRVPGGNAQVARIFSQDRSLRPGTHCALQLKVDQVRTLSCTAEIVRVGSEGVGLRFVSLDSSDRAVLDRVLERFNRQELYA